MRKHVPIHNLFTGLDGSTTDGSVVGASESFAGWGEPMHVTLLNGGGYVVNMEMREIPEHASAQATNNVWTQLGHATNCTETIHKFFDAGKQYRFSILQVGSTTEKPRISLRPIKDNAYTDYNYFEHHHNDEHWQCDAAVTGNAARLISPIPAQRLGDDCLQVVWQRGECLGISWTLSAGSTPGGNDLYTVNGNGGETSHDICGLPIDCSDIHVTLVLECADSTTRTLTQSVMAACYTESSFVGFCDSSVMGTGGSFSWSNGDNPNREYRFYLGTTQGGSELLASGIITAESQTAQNLPNDGTTVYAVLEYSDDNFATFDTIECDFQSGVITNDITLLEHGMICRSGTNSTQSPLPAELNNMTPFNGFAVEVYYPATKLKQVWKYDPSDAGADANGWVNCDALLLASQNHVTLVQQAQQQNTATIGSLSSAIAALQSAAEQGGGSVVPLSNGDVRWSLTDINGNSTSFTLPASVLSGGAGSGLGGATFTQNATTGFITMSGTAVNGTPTQVTFDPHTGCVIWCEWMAGNTKENVFSTTAGALYDQYPFQLKAGGNAGVSPFPASNGYPNWSLSTFGDVLVHDPLVSQYYESGQIVTLDGSNKTWKLASGATTAQKAANPSTLPSIWLENS